VTVPEPRSPVRAARPEARGATIAGKSALALATAAVVVASALPGSASAVRLDYDLGLSVLRSDNIGLSDAAPVEETVVSPGLRFSASQAGSTFRLDARGDLQYLHYVDGSFDDGFRGALSAQAGWTLIQERLEFVVEDYLSRQPIDTLAAFSPGNEQQANMFIAGPTLFARLGDATRAQVDLRYGNSRAEENDAFDSDRYTVALRGLRELSRTRRIGINAEATRVDYDIPLPGTDYTRYDGYVSYGAELRQFDVSIEAGYSRLELEDRPDNHTDPLFRGRLTWRLSPRSTLDAGVGYQFIDAAQDLVVLDAGAGNPQVPIGPDVYRQRRADAGYRYDGERVDLRVGGYFQRVNYVDAVAADSDQDSHGGGFEVGYLVRPRTRLSILGAIDSRDYGDLAREDEESTLGVALAHEFTRNWSARIDLLRRQRDSSEAGQDYDENAAAISFTYRR
jgi:hypothetical protein